MTELAALALASTALKQEELFPIREVSRLTGVNPVTLRAWERRYGLIQPTRTESGHRLYSQANIEAIRSILAWLERGVAVSKVGKILQRNELAQASAAPVSHEVASGEWGEWQQQIRHALSDFDQARLEQVYGQIFSSYPLAVVFQDVLMPLWQQLRLRQNEFGRSSEWLFFDNFLRARALQRLQLARGASDVRVVLAAMPGQCHELELLVCGLLLGDTAIALTVLAQGQPLEELTLVCEKLQPQLLVLFSNHPPANDFARQMARLALTLECPLAIAGEVSELAAEQMSGSSVACLGNDGRSLQRRMQQLLRGHLDT
ncbi:MAG: MerR family transcriptional regulator [Pseudomonas sp.]|uniref:MerR family transcriptional regulator n=1 Tax=Pseudomonas sp. TaxID=306 RepID=UPI003BB4B1AC